MFFTWYRNAFAETIAVVTRTAATVVRGIKLVQHAVRQHVTADLTLALLAFNALQRGSSRRRFFFRRSFVRKWAAGDAGESVAHVSLEALADLLLATRHALRKFVTAEVGLASLRFG